MNPEGANELITIANDTFGPKPPEWGLINPQLLIRYTNNDTLFILQLIYG